MKHNRVLLGFLAAVAAMMFLFCGDNIVKVPAGSGGGQEEPATDGGAQFTDDGFVITKKGANYVASRKERPGLGKTAKDAFPSPAASLQATIDYINTNGTRGVPIEVVFGKDDGKDQLDIGSGNTGFIGDWGAPVITLRGAITGTGKLVLQAKYGDQPVSFVRPALTVAPGVTVEVPPAYVRPPTSFEADVYNCTDPISNEKGFCYDVNALYKALPAGGFTTAQEAIAAIKNRADGKNVKITFGRDGEELNVGKEPITFEGSGWGTVILVGEITGEVTGTTKGVIIIGDGSFNVEFVADLLTVINTAASGGGNNGVFVSPTSTAVINVTTEDPNADGSDFLKEVAGFLDTKLVTASQTAWITGNGASQAGYIINANGTARAINKPYGTSWGYSSSDVLKWASDKGILTVTNGNSTVLSKPYIVSNDRLYVWAGTDTTWYSKTSVGAIGSPAAPSISNLAVVRTGATSVRATFTASEDGEIKWGTSSTTAAGSRESAGTVTAGAGRSVEISGSSLAVPGTGSLSVYFWLTNLGGATSAAGVGETVPSNVLAGIPELTVAASPTFDVHTRKISFTLTSTVAGSVHVLSREVVNGARSPAASDVATNVSATPNSVTANAATAISSSEVTDENGDGTYEAFVVVKSSAGVLSAVAKIGSSFTYANPNVNPNPASGDLQVITDNVPFGADYEYVIDGNDTTVVIKLKSYMQGDLFYLVNSLPNTGIAPNAPAAQIIAAEYFDAVTTAATQTIALSMTELTDIHSAIAGSSGFAFYAVIDPLAGGARSNVVKIAIPGWDATPPVISAGSLQRRRPIENNEQAATLSITLSSFGGAGVDSIWFVHDADGVQDTWADFADADTVLRTVDPPLTASSNFPVALERNLVVTANTYDSAFVVVKSKPHAAGGGLRSEIFRIYSAASDNTPPVLSAGGVVARYKDSIVNFTFASDEVGVGYYAVVEAGEEAPTASPDEDYTEVVGWTMISSSGGVVASTNTFSIAGPDEGALDVYVVVMDGSGNISNAEKIEVLAAPGATVSAPEWTDDADPTSPTITGFTFNVQASFGTGTTAKYYYLNGDATSTAEKTYAELTVAGNTLNGTIANTETDVAVTNSTTTSGVAQKIWVVVEVTHTSSSAKYYSEIVTKSLGDAE